MRGDGEVLDEEDFDAIFRAHRARVLALCRQLCGDQALAEDALQDTFLAVHRALARFRGDAELGTWIYRIAMRTALRVRARHLRPVDVEPELDATDPRAALEARDRAQRVRVALLALPAAQQVVIALFVIDGLGHAEIARILGVPEGTVWSRLYKARKALAAAAP